MVCSLLVTSSLVMLGRFAVVASGVRQMFCDVTRITRLHPAGSAIDRVVVTDLVPAFRLGAAATRQKVDMLPAAPLLAEAIRRLYAGDTLTGLLVF